MKITFNPLVLLFTMFSGICVYSQNSINPNPKSQGFSMPEVSRPSPSVSQLMKVEETNISHYTGQPNISIPLYSKNIGGFDYSLGLTYNVSGIRPEDHSSWVGKGWSMEGAGAVSRTVQDLPDDILTGKYVGVNHYRNANNHVRARYNDFYKVNDVSFNVVPNSLSVDINDNNSFVRSGQADAYFYDSLFGKDIRNDTKRDIYQFSALGRTGRFIFTLGSNGLVPKMIGDKNNFIIDWSTSEIGINSNFPHEVIDSFTITDSSGYVFYFDAIEETKTITTTYTKYEGEPEDTGSADGNSPFYRSAWKLTKVNDSKGVELISFTYDNTGDQLYIQKGTTINRYRIPCSDLTSYSSTKSGGINGCGFDLDVYFDADADGQVAMLNDYWECINAFHSEATISAAIDFGNSGGGAGSGCANDLTCRGLAYEPVFSSSSSYTTVKGLSLREVNFRDGFKLFFDKEDGHPEYTGGYKLLSIKQLIPDYPNYPITGTTKLFKEFKFNYNSGYLSMRSGSPPNNLYDQKNGYLVLDEIKALFHNDSNTTSMLSSYKFDYNPFGDIDSEDVDDFGYYKSPLNARPQIDPLAGSLSSITYPTKGKRQFIWEANRYSFKGNKLLSYKEILKNPDNQSIITTTTESHTTSFSSINPNAISNQTLQPSPSMDQFIDIEHDQEVNMHYNVTNGLEYVYPYNIWIWYQPVDQQGNIIPSAPIKSFRFRSNSPLNDDVKIFLNAGRYKVNVYQNILEEARDHVTYPTSTNGTLSTSIDLTFEIKKIKTGSLNWWLYGGGLRMKEINYFSDSDPSHSIASYTDVIDYRLEPNVFPYSVLSNDGYPMPTDYFVPPNSLYSGSDPIHNFSSGSIDGESSLRREYVYRKAPLHTQANPQGMLTPRYYTIEKRSALASQLTQGSYIGYKNIAMFRDDDPLILSSNERNIQGKSVTKYTYDSPLDYSFHPQDYVYPFPPYEADDFLRGNLRNVKTYSIDNKLINETTNEYNYDNNEVFDYITRDIEFSFNPSVLGNDFNLISKSFDNYSRLINDQYSMNLPPYCDLGVTISNFLGTRYPQQGDLVSVFNIALQSSVRYDFYKSHKVELVNAISKDYYFEGTEVADPITGVINGSQHSETSTFYEYNSRNYKPTVVTTTNSEGVVLKSKTIYSNDFNSHINPTLLTAMRDANLVSVPLVQETRRNNDLVSRVKYYYEDFSTNQFLPSSVAAQKSETDPLENRLTYHLYDQYGNVLDVSKEDGTHVSYIYGYDKSLPIAKIEGLSYQELAHKMSTVNTIQQLIDNVDESDLVRDLPSGNNLPLPTVFEDLRDSFSISDPILITTYEYELGVGIKKVTDPRGRTMTYHYDDFNRLEYVTDHEGNIVSKNEYKYATQH